MSDRPLSYTKAAAAAATGLSETTLERAINSGRLKAKRSSATKDGEPAGRVLILASALEDYLESLVDA